MPAAAALLMAACHGPSPGPTTISPAQPAGNAALATPPLVMTIAATPPDVPSVPPACGGSTYVRLPVPLAIASLVSACSTPLGQVPYQMVVTNLTNDVLDVAPAGLSQPQVTVDYPAPGGLLDSWDTLEVSAQNEVVRQLRPPAGAYLLPVGGSLAAGSDYPIDLNVTVDPVASSQSYAAQLMTGYVVDNLRAHVPEGSLLGYQASIADCVNAAYSLWQDLSQPSPDVTGTVLAAILTVKPCQELQAKVSSDQAEQIAAAASANDLSRSALEGDLARVADTAGEGEWESSLQDLAKLAGDVADALH